MHCLSTASQVDFGPKHLIGLLPPSLTSTAMLALTVAAVLGGTATLVQAAAPHYVDPA